LLAAGDGGGGESGLAVERVKDGELEAFGGVPARVVVGVGVRVGDDEGAGGGGEGDWSRGGGGVRADGSAGGRGGGAGGGVGPRDERLRAGLVGREDLALVAHVDGLPSSESTVPRSQPWRSR